MKKSTIETMISYLNGAVIDTAELLNTLQGELAHLNEKANANATLYSSARDIVLETLTDKMMTCADLYETIKDKLPGGFSRSKLQYGLNNTWANDIHKQTAAKGANLYMRAV